MPFSRLQDQGAEQFSSYQGYGFNFRWEDDFEDKESGSYGIFNCLDNHIIAVDAVMSPHAQFATRIMNRDIDKLYAALANLPGIISHTIEH